VECSGGDLMKFTKVAMDILEKRYLMRDENGKVIETPEQMFERVAWDIAKVEDDQEYWARKFYEVMSRLEFLPNSPCLFNAGTGNGLSYSACYGLPVEDSIESIFDTLKQAAIIFKSGGGVGFNFSRLRPEGDIVRGTMGVSSGPISFMKIYDVMVEQIKQGGKRRGAAMGIMHVSHPDIEKFISCKRKEGEFSNFNISVLIPDMFMIAVLNDAIWPLKNPRTGEVVKTVKARELFNKMVENAWYNGEPGFLFYDTINRTNTCKHLGMIEVTNPCSELPLRYYESCNLGSIDVSKFVSGNDFDWKRLGEVVKIAIRFLDNVIDAQPYVLREIEEETKKTRKVGLGVMGWHDALLKMGIPYDSGEALKIGKRLMRFIQETSHKASEELAEEKGVFPAWEGSEWYEKGIKMRNATTTTIAPTGSLSILANCSSGIEPVFNWVYERDNTIGEKYFVVHRIFEEMLKKRGLYDEDVIRMVYEYGSIQDIPIFEEDDKMLFKNALDIDWKWHITMQSTFQKYVDNSISKTINMRHEATVDDVRNAVITAWQVGCKGMTVYRAGSRQNEVMRVGRECRSGRCNL